MNRSLAAYLIDVPLRDLLARALDRLIAWQAQAREAHHLRSMDDRLLKDIGLSRADVERVLQGRPPHL